MYELDTDYIAKRKRTPYIRSELRKPRGLHRPNDAGTLALPYHPKRLPACSLLLVLP